MWLYRFCFFVVVSRVVVLIAAGSEAKHYEHNGRRKRGDKE
jgi:hypothetical protein